VLNLGTHGDQVVLAPALHAVTRVIEQSDFRPLSGLAEIADGAAHLLVAGVGEATHLEAHLFEGLGHGLHVVGRVGQRRIGIGGVAHQQGDAGGGVAGGAGKQCQAEGQ